MGFLTVWHVTSKGNSLGRRDPGSCILLTAWPQSHGESVLPDSVSQSCWKECQHHCKSRDAAAFEKYNLYNPYHYLLSSLLLQDGSPSGGSSIPSDHTAAPAFYQIYLVLQWAKLKLRLRFLPQPIRTQTAITFVLISLQEEVYISLGPSPR